MRIIIRTVEMPAAKKPDDIIKWFCEVLGIAAGSDSDVEERIFRAFAYAAQTNSGISSSDITLRQGLARSTVIYHLNRLIDMGLITKKGRRYYLRATNMARMVEELEYDLDREMNRMLNVAQEFDRLMLQQGAKSRRTKAPKKG
jgi:predicted transcriptional regulator